MRLSGLVLAALAVAVVGCSGGGTKVGGEARHTVVLTIATHERTDRDLREYIAAVRRLSEGSIRLEVRHGWQPGKDEAGYDRATITDVRRGDVDLAKIGVRSYDLLGVEHFQALSAPFLVDGLAIEERVLASGLAEEMLAGVQALGVEGVALIPGEPRRPFGLTRRLLEPSDYREAWIGSKPSRISARTLRALGAIPRPYDDDPRDLSPWAFDGAEVDLATLESNGWANPGSSLTANVAFWPRAFTVVANRDMLEELTSKQREVLGAAGREALAQAIARLRAEDRTSAGILCRRDDLALVEATPSQLAALREAVRPIYTGLEREAKVRALVAEIEAMKRRVPPEPALRCPERARLTRPPFRREKSASPLDGTWEMRATRAEVIASGAPPDTADVDAGRYRLVLRRGRVVLTHLSPPRWGGRPGGVFRVSVRDKTIDWRFPDGETAIYHYNVYRSTLTLRYVPGERRGAPNPTLAPWHRVGP
jgi:TRAP-type C4-dicarboxylate transport system substrate-binding protein